MSDFTWANEGNMASGTLPGAQPVEQDFTWQQPKTEKPAPEAPTSGDTPPAEPGALAGFLTQVGRTTTELLPLASYMVGKATPGVGGVVDLAIDQISTPAENGREAFAATAADRSSMGMLDSLAGGKAALNTLLSGQGLEAAQQAGQEAQDTANRNLAEARQSHRLASLGGDVVGSIAVGAPFSLGFNTLLGATRAGASGLRSTAAVAAAAGSEEGLYTLNTTQNPEDAAKAAAYGAAAGTVFKTVFDIGGGAIGLLRGKGSEAVQAEAGHQILMAMQAKAAQQGQELSIPDAIKLIEANPDKVLSDLYPSAVTTVRDLASSPNPNAQEAARSLLQSRNDLVFNYDAAVRGAINSSEVMTPTRYAARLDSSKAALRPKYDDLFNRMDAAKWHMKTTNVGDYIFQKFDGALSTAGQDADIIQRLIDEKATRGRMSFREVNELRKAVNNEILQRIRRNNSGANTEVLPIKNLKTARDELNLMLRNNSMFRELQDTYGDLEKAADAYKFGQSIIQKKGLDSADAIDFLGGDKSEAVVDAFINGAKYNMYALAKDAPDPAKVLKDGRLQDFRAVVGDEYVDTMLVKVQEAVNFQGTKNALVEGMENMRAAPRTRSAMEQVMELRTASEAVTGEAKGLAQRTAIGRAMRNLRGEGLPTSGELEKRAASEVQAYLTPGGAAANLSALQQQFSNNPTLRQLMAIGGSTATTGPTAGAAQDDGYGALRDYLTSR